MNGKGTKVLIAILVILILLAGGVMAYKIKHTKYQMEIKKKMY